MSGCRGWESECDDDDSDGEVVEVNDEDDGDGHDTDRTICDEARPYLVPFTSRFSLVASKDDGSSSSETGTGTGTGLEIDTGGVDLLTDNSIDACSISVLVCVSVMVCVCGKNKIESE